MGKLLTALVIDDHPLQVIRLRQILVCQNVNVLTAECVFDALELVDCMKIDLVFCDLQMPGQDGIDMLEALNQRSFNGKVVLVSAMELAIVASVRAMCEGYSFEVLGKLLKPYNKHQVSKLLSQTMSKTSKVINSSPQIEIEDQEFLFALGEGRIKNYYQPLIDASTGRTVGFEALARWCHPIHGVLSPYHFLPIVSRCSLYAELFDAVLNNALFDIKERGLKQKISLNVSHENLTEPCFFSYFFSRCNQHDVCPRQFIIEITERDTYNMSEVLYKNLLKLRMRGVTISIDDFGTGTSSLDKLARLPFNELKIDRSFIHGMLEDDKKLKIVLAICALAKNLNLSVVAEGIEDEMTFNAVKKYNIDILQGYYFSKPMPLESLKILS